MATYTVKKGDTLSAIAWKYNPTYHYGNTVKEAYMRLAEINHIENPNHIVVGQVLKLDNPKKSDNSNEPIPPAKSKGSSVVIKAFGIQSDTDRTLYISWTWTKSNTKEYKVMWYYDTGDGVWFIGDDSNTTYKQSTYNAPANAKRVRVKVKPISKTYTKKNKEIPYWKASSVSWSTLKTYAFDPDWTDEAPSAPSVSIDEDKLNITAELDNIGDGPTHIQFQMVRNDSKVSATGISRIVTAHAAFKCKVSAGYEYKVRCRGITRNANQKITKASEWSDYSDGILTRPGNSKGIKTLRATSSTSIIISWYTALKATSYEIQYTTERKYFDSSPNNVTSVTVESNVAHSEITGLESGDRYYFRVRAINDSGSSGWTGIKSVVIGLRPDAPTTWSSKSTAVVGDEILLYWMHNTEDGSDERYAEVSISRSKLDGGLPVTHTIKKDTKPDDPDEAVDETSYYKLKTYSNDADTYIDWQVRTRGILDKYGPWSTKRRVRVYAQPSLVFDILDYNKKVIHRGHNKTSGEIDISTPIDRLPFFIRTDHEPSTDDPISIDISITAVSSYTYVDYTGATVKVNRGDEIYSKHHRTANNLFTFSPTNVSLENNAVYRITATMTSNIGLTASYSEVITIGWINDRDYEPTCTMEFNEESLTASINAYCVDEDNHLTSATKLAIYRHNYDGSFTEIATGLPNNRHTFVCDPHPSLNYMWYRIVATFTDTGVQTYYDPEAEPVNIPCIVIQWNETASSYLNYDSVYRNSEIDDSMFEIGYPDDFTEYTGSRVILPYNVDVTPSLNRDIALVEYIGRENPVSYYGTQLGETAVLNADIPKDDEATLYSLRRLAQWQGDVYIREPSGIGYSATVNVSYSIKHGETIVPVTINVTKVEPTETIINMNKKVGKGKQQSAKISQVLNSYASGNFGGSLDDNFDFWN